MSLTTEQKVTQSYKRDKGAADTRTEKTYFEELVGGRVLYGKDLWVYDTSIPATAPGGGNNQVIGVVQRKIDLQLTAVPGSPHAFYHADLVDLIPDEFGASYVPVVKNSLAVVLPVGYHDYEFDNKAGILRFYNTAPLDNMPPYVSFYRYVGAKGAAGSMSGGSGITVNLGTIDLGGTLTASVHIVGNNWDWLLGGEPNDNGYHLNSYRVASLSVAYYTGEFRVMNSDNDLIRILANSDGFAVGGKEGANRSSLSLIETLSVGNVKGFGVTAQPGGSYNATFTDFAQFQVISTNKNLLFSDSQFYVQNTHFTWNTTSSGITITFVSPTAQGLKYASDISQYYTNRSLVDKGYVLSLLQGLSPHPEVRVATTVDLVATASGAGVNKTLTAEDNGAIVVDGVTLSAGDRVLVKNQAITSDNGVYLVTIVGNAGAPFILTRATDFDGTGTEVSTGDYLYVKEGTANHGTGWFLLSNASGTYIVDTDELNFTLFISIVQLASGNGTVVTGGQINVDASEVAGSGLEVMPGAGNEHKLQVTRYTPVGTTTVVRKFVESGAFLTEDGVGYQVAHNLGTRAVQVSVYDESNWEQVYLTVIVSVNDVTLYSEVGFTATIVITG